MLAEMLVSCCGIHKLLLQLLLIYKGYVLPFLFSVCSFFLSNSYKHLLTDTTFEDCAMPSPAEVSKLLEFLLRKKNYIYILSGNVWHFHGFSCISDDCANLVMEGVEWSFIQL